jgi:hypothetical protein
MVVVKDELREVVIRQHHGGFQLRDIKLGRIQDQMILLLEEEGKGSNYA